MAKIFALDYGKKHIGIAVSDRDRIMAFPRPPILNNEVIFEQLRDSIKQERPELLLIGLPFKHGDEETDQTVNIRKFAEKLKQFLSQHDIIIEMEFIDESFSSFEADKLLQKQAIDPRDRKKFEDSMAAMLLIHRYIGFNV